MFQVKKIKVLCKMVNFELVYYLEGNAQRFQTLAQLISYWPDRFKFPLSPIQVGLIGAGHSTCFLFTVLCLIFYVLCSRLRSKW